MPSVFFSYSHVDETLRDQLEKQLAMLKRQGVIDTWHDRRIVAGENIDTVIDNHIKTADIILLLISPDFIASDYCYEREMMLAMERHNSRDATVIPVILRACDWHGAPFGKLLAVPTDGKPVTQWSDRDQAFLEVAKAVRKAAERFGVATPVQEAEPILAKVVGLPVSSSRSSNLRLRKQFTERDKDKFKIETFEYIANYFQNSLQELDQRNEGIEGNFRRIDSNRFTAAVYNNGKAMTRCTIFMGGSHFGGDIAYSANETTASNSFNESLNIEADEHMLYLRSMGMFHFRDRGKEEKLSQEGAAELFWGMFIERLQ